MPIAQGAVLVLPFPYSDRLAEKRRPALVVSAASLERDFGLLWVVMITSARGARRDGDVPISNLQRAGLPAPSLIRPTKLTTIEPNRIVRRAGAVSAVELRQTLEAIQARL